MTPTVKYSEHRDVAGSRSVANETTPCDIRLSNRGGVLLCKLCGSNAPLMKSHVFPKFVGRWMKETSITPYLRFAGNVDERRQDLATMELLCDDCENRFSAWERKFANEIFRPVADGKAVFRYGPWFVKFAASLSWRAIQFLKSQAVEEPPALNSMVDDMELHLLRFLVGQEKHVGSYTQHVYPVGELAAPVRPGSPMLNRFLARSVWIDVLRNDDLSEVMVYVKLPMFMFFSIGETKHKKWRETSRIKKSSVLQPKDHVLPEAMLEYFLEQSDKMGDLLDSMSPKSEAVADRAIRKAIETDPDRMANSRLMRAMLADYQLYGEQAVVYRD